MSYLLGLTGSIGMGKSTTCALFAKRGCGIWDADLTVHQAYGPAERLWNPLVEFYRR